MYWARYRDISRTTWDINFKLEDSMYHHRKTIWLDFGERRSRVTEVNLWNSICDPWPLTYILQNLIRSSSYGATYYPHVRSSYLKWFLRYRVNGQTGRTYGRTYGRTDVRTDNPKTWCLRCSGSFGFRRIRWLEQNPPADRVPTPNPLVLISLRQISFLLSFLTLICMNGGAAWPWHPPRYTVPTSKKWTHSKSHFFIESYL